MTLFSGLHHKMLMCLPTLSAFSVFAQDRGPGCNMSMPPATSIKE